MKNILLYVDEQCFSINALNHAQKLAEKFKAKITILYVQNSESPLTLVGTEVVKKARGKYQDQENNEILQEAKRHFNGHGLEIKSLTSLGEPAVVMQNVARNQGCDAIVIAAPKLTIINKIFSRNIANKLVNTSTIPVTVVK